MMRVLNFPASIKLDQSNLSFALPRTIQKRTELSLHNVSDIILDAERNGLVRTMRTNLSGPDGILAAMITEKVRLKVNS
jgi:hypothetical protein